MKEFPKGRNSPQQTLEDKDEKNANRGRLLPLNSPRETLS